MEAGGVDVMLLDLGLPDIDGMELMWLLDERGTSVPTIVVTARSHPRVRAAALDRGARDFVTKPFTLASVIGAVRACLPHTCGGNQRCHGVPPSTPGRGDVA